MLVTMKTNVLLSVSHLKWQLCPENNKMALCVQYWKSPLGRRMYNNSTTLWWHELTPLICRGWLGSGLAGIDHLVLQKMDTFPISCFIHALHLCLDEQKNNNARFSTLQRHRVPCLWLDCKHIIRTKRGSSKLGSSTMFDQTLKYQKEIVMVHVNSDSYHW